MALSDFMSVPVLICLGVTLVLIGLLGIYFSQKMQEQNHKITSMLGLVSTMAEEMNYMRSRLLMGGSMQPMPMHMNTSEHIMRAGQSDTNDVVESENLIEVSDGEDDDSEDSDNSDSDSDSDSDSEDSSSDNDDGDDEIQANIKILDNIASIDEDDLLDANNIKIINFDESLNATSQSQSQSQSNTENINEIDCDSDSLSDSLSDDGDDDSDGDEDDDNKSPIRGEKIEILNQSTNDATLFNPELLKMIDISATLETSDLEEVKGKDFKSSNIDYKKLSLNKLRDIVTAKNLSDDPSKLKKNEMLKLLGSE